MLYDAVYVAAGRASVDAIKGNGDARHIVLEAYKHFKTIGGAGDAQAAVRSAVGDGQLPGVVLGAGAGAIDKAFIDAPATSM